jgi:hypothetical protein
MNRTDVVNRTPTLDDRVCFCAGLMHLLPCAGISSTRRYTRWQARAANEREGLQERGCRGHAYAAGLMGVATLVCVQVSIRAPCCKKWYDCPECHEENESHELAKGFEMVFACKKCKKVFRKDTRYDRTGCVRLAWQRRAGHADVGHCWPGLGARRTANWRRPMSSARTATTTM